VVCFVRFFSSGAHPDFVLKPKREKHFFFQFKIGKGALYPSSALRNGKSYRQRAGLATKIKSTQAFAGGGKAATGIPSDRGICRRRAKHIFTRNFQ